MPTVADIIRTLNQNPDSVKTAAAHQGDGGAAVRQAGANLSASLQALQQTKTAAPVAATHSLEKIASELAEADSSQMYKEAGLYGAAVFDAFVARANQYAANAPSASNTKVAAYHADNEMLAAQHYHNEKVAHMNKTAAEYGYHDAEVALQMLQGEKTASMNKTAAEYGYHDAEVALGMLQQEKTASDAREHGVMDAMHKLAAAADDCFERGFQHMATIHASA
jgi:hypothetical protein